MIYNIKAKYLTAPAGHAQVNLTRETEKTKETWQMYLTKEEMQQLVDQLNFVIYNFPKETK